MNYLLSLLLDAYFTTARIKTDFAQSACPHWGVIYRLFQLVANTDPSGEGALAQWTSSIFKLRACDELMALRTRCMNKRWMGRCCQIAAIGLLSPLVLSLTGCASAPSASDMPNAPSASASDNSGVIGFLGSMSDKALSAIGLKKPDTSDMPDVPDDALPDRRITWRIYASDSLNVDENGKPLGLVLRLYKLKSPDAFLQAPVDTFGDPAKEKAAFNDDLVAARELQLLPGQHYEVTDKVTRGARYVGIVALFRTPLPGRWRYAFSAAAADKTGLSIGAHACAMSIQIGEAIGQAASTVRSVAIPCP